MEFLWNSKQLVNDNVQVQESTLAIQYIIVTYIQLFDQIKTNLWDRAHGIQFGPDQLLSES